MWQPQYQGHREAAPRGRGAWVFSWERNIQVLFSARGSALVGVALFERQQACGPEAGAATVIRLIDRSISSSNRRTYQGHREAASPRDAGAKGGSGCVCVCVCGSIRRMDSSITSSSHSIKDTARQRRPVQMGVSVCVHVAAFVVWTVVSVVAATVSRTPRGSIGQRCRSQRRFRVCVCVYVAAFVVWTVVSVVASTVSRTPRGSGAQGRWGFRCACMWQHSSYGQ